MAGIVVSHVVRSILTANVEMPADEVIVRAKAKGVKAPDASIRGIIHKLKSELRKKAAKPVVVATAARTTAPAKPVKTAVASAKAATTPAKTAAAPTKAAAKPAVSAPSNLSTVFSNVTLVNKVVGIAGGVDQARQVAEAVKACGGVDAFLKHLDLVAGIRSA